MKQLMRRLSRVSDSSQYTPLRNDTIYTSRESDDGGVPMYVGDELERFGVSPELLNHPIFVKLLNKSAQEYGYKQRGVLRIPCRVIVFQRVLEAVRLGKDVDDREIEDLIL